MRPEHDTHAQAARLSPPLALALFAVAGAVAYANVLDSFFLSDDFVLLGRVFTGDLSPAWGRDDGGFFRPAVVLSYWLDHYWWWGRRPLGFHLTNVALHALNSFLVLLLARALLAGEDASPARREATALVAGLFFLLHPSHAEAVTWVSGRGDLLATLFGLASLWFYLRHAGAPRRAPFSFFLLLSLLCFSLALLAKESAVFIPAAVFLLGARAAESSGLRPALARGARAALPFALILLAYFCARWAALGSLVGGYGAARHLDFSHSTIVSQLLRYPLRAFFPAVVLRHLPFLESRRLSPVLIGLGVTAVLAALFALARGERRRRLANFARRHTTLWTLCALFGCSLLPVVNLRIDVFTTQGERYLYFPSAFFCVALARATLGAARGRAAAWAAVLCALTFYSASLWMTNRRWAEAARLSRSILRDLSAQSGGGIIVVLNAPDNFGGVHLFRNGLPEALRQFAEAGRTAAADARVVAWHGLGSRRGGAVLSEDGAGGYALSLADEGETFERVDGGAAEVEVIERDARRLRLRLRLKGGATPIDVFYFGGGRMIKVSAAAPSD